MLSSITKARPVSIFVFALFFLLVYQIAHMIDHILQYMQGYVLGIDNPPSLFEGVLNASDTTIHLWLNLFEWVGITVLWLSFRESQVKQSVTKFNMKRPKPLSILMAAIFFLVIFQTFHVLDHILQYVQLFTMGIEGPPGLFQGLLGETDRVVHTWVNGIIIVAIVVLWASFRNCQVKGIIHPEIKIQE